MQHTRTPVRSIIPFGTLCLFLWAFVVPAAAAPSVAQAPIVDAGFSAWAKSGPDLALDAWQKGGLLEGDQKISAQSAYFRRLDRALGNYRFYELLESKAVGQYSQVLYFSINFERGAVYARFHLYRADKNWVVQNMDFSTKPELIMPWLAYEGVKYSE